VRRGVDRARVCWESDRCQVVDDLGAKLPKAPRRIARTLGRCRQGADWLIEHWKGLAEVLESKGGWDEAQRRLAFDLLGVPPDLRDGSIRVPSATDRTALAELVAREIGRLEKRLETALIGLDEAEQSMAMSAMPLSEDATTARLRRYEASARRDFFRALDELRRHQQPDASAGNDRPPDRSIKPEPMPRPFELSHAAAAYLADRVDRLFVPPDPSEPSPSEPEAPPEVVAKETAVAPRPAKGTSLRCSPYLGPSTPPGNRRERRARQKMARQAARRNE
jgi:hypothetical protein